MVAHDNSTVAAPGGGNLLLLLVSLLFALLVAPIAEQAFGGHATIYVGATAVLVIGVFITRTRPRLFVLALTLAVLTMFAVWATLVVDYPMLFAASCVLEAAFFATIAGVLLVNVLKKHLATTESIFGALCVYLLLGLAWAQLYWATERIDVESLAVSDRTQAEHAAGPQRTTAGQASVRRPVPRYSQVVYFSFVTMSTLGYGDIVPETPIAQTLAWMQSVLGQFYLAVLVAWLVGALPRRVPPSGGLPRPASRDASHENEPSADPPADSENP